MLSQHTQRVARELLADGWLPGKESCEVLQREGAAARLIDYEVWLAMRAILAARPPQPLKK
jgi:hypothetical protein